MAQSPEESQAAAVNDGQATQYLRNKITSDMAHAYKGQRLWSAANHGATIIIVVFSAVAALLAQAAPGNMVLSVPLKNVVTALSLLVTVVSTLQSKLGFERKWIANRITRSALEQLEIDENTGLSASELAKALKIIRAKHDEAITATGG